MATAKAAVMTAREEATELARGLAIKGHSKWKIRKRLAERGLAGQLEDCRLDELWAEGRYLDGLIPKRISLRLQVGVGIAILLWGGFLMWWSRNPFVFRYGSQCVVLGLVLLGNAAWERHNDP